MSADNNTNKIGEKNITTTIRILPRDHHNINKTIKEKLEQAFVGKCYSGCYIISIEGITKRGLVLVDKNSRGGKCNVDVQFKAKYIKYESGDLICNAVISKMNNDRILINNPYFTGLIHITPNVKKAKEGDFIPVSINMSRYYIHHESCVAVCELMNFPKAIYYKVKGNPKDVDTDSYKKLELSAAEKTKLKKYDDILVKYNKKTVKGSVKKLDQITSLKEGDVIGRPESMSRFDGFMVLDSASAKSVQQVEETAESIYEQMLNDYVKFTNIYKIMNDTYKTADFEKIKKYYQ